MSSMMADPMNAQFLPSANQRPGANPLLPAHPASEAADSQYLAAEAILRANISKQYADILQQLGFTDASGNFIPGSVSVNAARQASDLRRSSDIAAENVTNDAQRIGTLFSGKRGTDQARAQYPFQQSLAQLGIDVPMTLSQLWEQAAGLIDQYNLQNNQLLADAAARRAQAATQNPGGDPTPPAQQQPQQPPLSTNLNPGGNPITNDGGPGTGLTGDSPGTIIGAPTYPNLDPTSPTTVYTPVTVGGTTSAEPRGRGPMFPGQPGAPPVAPPARAGAAGSGSATGRVTGVHDNNGALTGGITNDPNAPVVVNPPSIEQTDPNEFTPGPASQLPETTVGGIVNDPDYPHANPQAPSQISVPVIVGGNVSAEPKPTAGNIDPDEAARQRQEAADESARQQALAQQIAAAIAAALNGGNAPGDADPYAGGSNSAVAAGQAAVNAAPIIVPGRGRAL